MDGDCSFGVMVDLDRALDNEVLFGSHNGTLWLDL